jgi:hypothetical protein
MKLLNDNLLSYVLVEMNGHEADVCRRAAFIVRCATNRQVLIDVRLTLKIIHFFTFKIDVHKASHNEH